MAKLYNLAAMTVASTGTGTITLGSAATINGVLYLSFAAAGASNAETVAYSINDVGGSEVGTGTYTSAGTTLSRTPIISTNSNNAINMTAAAIVRISPAKEDIANLREANTFTAANTFSVSVSSPIYASASSLTFQSNGSTFAGIINTSQQWLIGTTSVTQQSGVQLTVSKNTGAPATAPVTGTLAYFYNVDGTVSNISIDGYGTGASPGVVMRGARGTAVTPTGTQSGDTLFSFNVFGYNTTGGFSGGSAFGQGLMQMLTLEAFTSAGSGTAWEWYTNAIGAVSSVRRVRIAQGLMVGTTTDPGVGLINTNSATFMLGSKTALTGGGTGNVPTLTAGPVAGNPTKWLPYDDAGTTRYIPAW